MIDMSMKYEQRSAIDLLKRIIPATVLLGLGSTGLSACASPVEMPRNATVTTVDTEDIQLQEGARVRSAPGVNIEKNDGRTNNILVLEESMELAANTVKITRDANGEWYGVPADILAEVLPENAEELLKDKDGTVWINEARASITEER